MKCMTWEEVTAMKKLPDQAEFTFERTQDGPVFNFEQRAVYHSPTGMEYGYGGSGPADAALNVLLHFVDGRTAWRLHQEFRWQFISSMNQEGNNVLRSQGNQPVDCSS